MPGRKGPGRQHGTSACYVWGPEPGRGPGCRCDLCKTGRAAAERARKHRTEPAYISATPARLHIRWLSEQGVGINSVKAATRLSTSCIQKILYGNPARGQAPSKRIRRTTNDRILAVTPAHGLASTLVPAGPLHDIVDRLVAVGVPKVRIAERLGQTGPGLQLGRHFITRRHAQVLKQMAAELDAGTLHTVRKVRGGETVIAPEAQAPPAPRHGDGFVLRVVEALEHRIDNRTWHAHAACTSAPTWMFFPGLGDMKTLAAAKRVCATCPVTAQCLNANIDERDGVFGGLSGAERRQLRHRKAA